MPASAAGSQAGTSRQNDPAGADRGSEQSQRRKPSSTLFRWCSFSAIVLPGISSTPPVMTRPISPAQWARTCTGPSASSIQPGICHLTEGREAGMNSITVIDAMFPKDTPLPGASRSTGTTCRPRFCRSCAYPSPEQGGTRPPRRITSSSPRPAWPPRIPPSPPRSTGRRADGIRPPDCPEARSRISVSARTCRIPERSWRARWPA